MLFVHMPQKWQETYDFITKALFNEANGSS